MGEEKEVILHGMWASPFAKRAQLALKIKGIPFDYVEEDLRNKSTFLVEPNPIYKKVPILVHKGRLITESLIIVEYIDETWPNSGPKLLPEDPWERARVRFWIAYIQKLLEITGKLYTLDKEEQRKGLEEVHEKLKVLENGMKEEFFPDEIRVNIYPEKLGILDIMMATTFGTFKVQEEVLGVQILDPHRNPLIFQWVEALIKLPVVKEIIPPHEKFIGFLRFLQQINFKFT